VDHGDGAAAGRPPQALNQEDQVTIVIITHDLDVAAQASRQIRLKDGKVLTMKGCMPNGAKLGVPVA